MNRTIVLLALLATASSASAQTPGIVNSRLEDPRAFFFYLVGGEGSATRPGQLAGIKDALEACGVQIQHDSDGNLRERLYLPNTSGNIFSTYANIEHNGTWIFDGPHGPAYVASSCSSSGAPPAPGGGASAGDVGAIAELLASLEQKLTDIRQRVIDIDNAIGAPPGDSLHAQAERIFANQNEQLEQLPARVAATTGVQVPNVPPANTGSGTGVADIIKTVLAIIAAVGAGVAAGK